MSWQYNSENRTWVRELLNFDTWGASIVRLPKDSQLFSTPLETDGSYHEFSIWLRRPKLGGNMSLRFLGKRYPRPGRCVYWRPDIESAEVSEVLHGTGYLFNFGWKIRDNMPKAQPV